MEPLDFKTLSSGAPFLIPSLVDVEPDMLGRIVSISDKDLLNRVLSGRQEDGWIIATSAGLKALLRNAHFSEYIMEQPGHAVRKKFVIYGKTSYPRTYYSLSLLHCDGGRKYLVSSTVQDTPDDPMFPEEHSYLLLIKTVWPPSGGFVLLFLVAPCMMKPLPLWWNGYHAGLRNRRSGFESW